jgi:hypothetical protein
VVRPASSFALESPAPASVGWSRPSVGQIVCCWVEPYARRQRRARELTAAAEGELRLRSIVDVELAYVVGNAGAEGACRRPGYTPRRVHSLKTLDQLNAIDELPSAPGAA